MFFQTTENRTVYLPNELFGEPKWLNLAVLKKQA